MIATDILYTLLYIGLMGYILLRHQRQNDGRWGIGSYTLLSYFIYPVIGAFWFFNPDNIYGEIEPLRLFPFIYLALMEWIAVRPVLQYDRNQIRQIEPPTMLFLNVFALIYIVCALLQVPDIIANMAEGLRKIMMDTAAGADMYYDSQEVDSKYDGVISNLPGIIFNVFSPLVFILFFYFLTLTNRHRLIEIGFGICILIKSFHSLSNGQRTEVTMSVINIFIAYIALKPMLPQKLQKWVRTVLIVLAVAIMLPFLAISVSRFGDREGGVLSSVIYYVGEAPYYFNDYALDANGTRHGDRTCNIFKQMIGMSAPKGIFGVRDAYPEMRMDDSIFSTFVGDFVLDFGGTVTAILFIVFSLVFSVLTRPNEPGQLPFHRLILIYFAMSVCMQGGFYLFNYSFERNLQILAIMVFYAFFGMEYLLRHKNERRITV